ncbi:Sodium/calcium exchanger protein-domain-containing protein [Pelagophyceae sp. CCMP2097]|nr:Sodium/calcium exchanger protein-domain-containing protein [Pelagophyceae sp. CCMP2097]
MVRTIGGTLIVALFVSSLAMVPAVALQAPHGRTNGTAVQIKCEHIAKRDDRCAFVQQHCGGVVGTVDYLALVYCGDEGAAPNAAYRGARVAGLALWLCLLLSLLGTTADLFFIDQLEFMAARLRLSPEVAGATLMACGNGAPDVFTAWNAIRNATDFPLVLAELLGASIFVTTVVLGLVLIVSPEQPVTFDAKPFARDTMMLALAGLVIACCAIDRHIDLAESCALMAIYAGYVVVIVRDKDNSGDHKRDATTDAQAPLLLLGIAAEAGMTADVDPPPQSDVGTGWCKTAAAWLGGGAAADEGRRVDAGDDSDEDGGGRRPLALPGVHWDGGASRFSRIVHVVEWPFSVVRHLSIPPATFEAWGASQRYLAASSMVGAAGVVAFDFGEPFAVVQGINVGAAALVCGFALGGAVLLSTTPDSPPSLHARTALVSVGFLATVAWLNLLASETVAVLEAIGAAAGLSSAVLGVTALAWGNCIGDAVADTAVARAGNTRMAVAAVFNSPLFSQIMALGVPVAVYCSNRGPLYIAVNAQAVVSFATLALSLGFTSIAAWYTNCALPKRHAYALFALYAAYLTTSIVIEMDILF